jgi:hypothetical protein
LATTPASTLSGTTMLPSTLQPTLCSSGTPPIKGTAWLDDSVSLAGFVEP